MASVISGAILRTQTDARLVALSRTGHQRAFEAIVERYRAELTRSVHRFLPSASVEDVLQQTHLEAWKALSGGTEVRELRAWLHRVARNAAIAVASRGYDYDELSDALAIAPGPEEELDRREAVRRALRGIAELPERQRDALLAVAVGGRSHAEVAFDLGITDSAARQLVRRARVSLLALATVLTPPQLVLWAARAGHTIVAGKAAAGGAALSGSLTGPALKVGAVALVVGGVAAGVAPIRHALAPPPPPAAHHHHHHAQAPRTPGYLTARPKRPGTPRIVGLTGPLGAPRPGPGSGSGPGPRETHAGHHRRSVSANPVGKTVSGGPAATPLSPLAPASAVTPSAPATQASGGLAALISWAVQYAAQHPTSVNQSTSSGSSGGYASQGSAGQAASPGQSQPAAPSGAAGSQCSPATATTCPPPTAGG